MKPRGHWPASPDRLESSLDWIRRLIGFDTTSRKSNLDLIEDVRAHLEDLGLAVTLTHDDSGAKANLFATLPDRAGNLEGGIVLSGHTDVVPVDGQEWSSDPFVAEIRGTRLYGRGACDMKGFLGTAIALAPTFATMRLRRPIHFALSYDEEVGCLGAPRMIADLVARGIRPDGCVVGEPTSMKPVVAHKGIRRYRCRVRGRAAHSSRTPEGVNAIEYAARLIVMLRARMDAERNQPNADPWFDVPFTTGSVGTIQGGTAANIVAQDCEFDFECRPMPGHDTDALESEIREHIDEVLLPAMRNEHPDSTIEWKRLTSVPGLTEDEGQVLLRLARALTREDRPFKVAYATEAGQFREANIETIVCGPGSIEQAHRPDEFVELEQVAACAQFLEGVARSLSESEGSHDR